MALFRISRARIAFAHDVFMAAVAFAISFYLRVGGTIGEYSAEAIALWVVLFTAVSAAVFASMRLYRGVWRYASLDDLLGIARAVTLASR